MVSWLNVNSSERFSLTNLFIHDLLISSLYLIFLGTFITTDITKGFPCSSVGKKNLFAMQKSTCSAGDLGSIPGSGRSPGEGNGNPLQYSCLENPMDRGAWQAIAHGVTRVGHDLALQISTFPLHITSMSVLYLVCWIEQRLVHSAWINIPWRIKAFYWEILPENRNFDFTNKTMSHPNTLKDKCILNFSK